MTEPFSFFRQDAENLLERKVNYPELLNRLQQAEEACQQLRQDLQELETLESDRVHLIEHLLKVGVALSTISDLDQLLEILLSACRKITYSDAGSIYLVDRSEPIHTVCFKIAQNDSQPDRSLNAFAVPVSAQSLVGYVALTGKSLNLPDAHELPEDSPFSHHRTFDEDISYRTRSVVVIPMHDSEARVMGVMQLINRKVRRDVHLTPENTLALTKPYSSWEESVVWAFASQAALVIERNRLLQRSGQNN